MNISGYSDDNTHDGDTTIIGDLRVDGKVFVNSSTSQSEYLDSGNYTSTISNIVGISNVSFDSSTRTYYEKQGNIVKLYTSLKITFTASLPSSFTFDMTVPALDLFETKILGSFCISTGGFANQYDADGFANVLNPSGTVRVIFQRLPLTTVNLPFGGDAYGSIIVIYKLEGEDVPASVLLAGGSGTGSVNNPMLETLDGGGFNIVNVGTIVATNITAPNVVTNPLNNNLNANNKNIININSADATTLNANNTNTTIISTDTINTLTASNITFSNNINMGTRNINNCSEIKTTGQPLRIIGGPLQLENDSGLTDILISNNIDLNGKDIKDVAIMSSTLLNVNTIRPNTTVDIIIDAPLGTAKLFGSGKAIVESPDDVEIICDVGSNIRLTNNLALKGQTIYLESDTGIIDVANGNINNVDYITNPDNPIVITGSKIEMRSNPPGAGNVEFYTNIDMTNRNIININTLESKIFNTIKYIRTQADFDAPLLLSGVYVIVGTVTMTIPLNIVASCLIAGYNNTSTLLFNITDGIENTYCLRNTNNSGNIEIKDFVFVNQCTSTRAGSLFTNSGVNTNILHVFNISYYNCKNNFPLRITGFEMVELINNTFRYNYGGTSGAMCSINSANNIIIEGCDFYNNYQLGNTSLIYISALLTILGTNNNITITGNQFATYGTGSEGGINISDFGTTNRVIIDGNIFDAEGGSDPLKLLNVDLSIHKGVICNQNTGIVSCKASLQGIVNSNTVYTATVLNTWVPIDLTGFTVGNISRFIPGLSPYSFIYDAKNPIKALISVNCSALQDTGGNDDVRLGISKNGVVSVYIEANLGTMQNKNLSLTTVIELTFSDIVQIVCQNITAGSDANGFLAVSLNASLIEI